MLSPRALVRGNPTRAKFAAENILERVTYNATWEYRDFDRKRVTDNACSDFLFDDVFYTL